MSDDYKTITEDEVNSWGKGAMGDYVPSYFADVLNGSYPLNEARQDILSFRKDAPISTRTDGDLAGGG